MNKVMSARNDKRGSIWRQWDLHFHSPSSFDYENKALTDKQLVDKLISEGIGAAAITDHHMIDVNRIQNLQKLGAERITILPGIELRDEHGGKPIHYICIFPEDSDLSHIWTTLQGSLGLTKTSVKEKGGDEKVYVPIKDAWEKTRALGGIISIHAGGKSNSIEEIKNEEQFQQRIKYDITKQYVHILEIGQLRDIASYRKIVFPRTGLEKPLVICSDNHDITTYSRKATTWLRCDPTFRGLLMVLREPSNRVFIGDEPPDVTRVRNNPTKIIDTISFKARESLPTGQIWFNEQNVPLNSGLVAVIGNKGSGKSALADSIGLLGATRNQTSCSFLNEERFCHPTMGYAQHFDAKLVFNSGESFTRGLDEIVKPQEVERVKYLPQDHIENVCNELSKIGDSAFEDELKSVIFSHVPFEKRLGQHSLDDLINFSADEKKRRIDTLLKSLKETSRARAQLESQLDPSVRTSLDEKIARIRTELEAHNTLKPKEVLNPSSSGATTTTTSSIISSIGELENQKRALSETLTTKRKELADAEKRHAELVKLKERIQNFQKEWSSLRESLSKDAQSLGFSLDDIVLLKVSLTPVDSALTDSSSLIGSLNQEINSADPPGLVKQISTIDIKMSEFQVQLDAPNKEYQNYLKAVEEWETKRVLLEGNESMPESLNGLTKRLLDLDKVPEEIAKVVNLEIENARQVFEEKKLLTSLYGDLYAPVQDFINTHPIAKDKLKLEFKAELVNDGFGELLLPMISQNRRGSFLGLDEGKARLDELTQKTNWQEWASVERFLTNVDRALHFDLREETPSSTMIKDQLIKGKRPEGVFNLLFGLEYLTPRYVLKWDGKDLSMLSPGERGTLLLVFYLLIDKGNDPLIIDQPEGNLDNQTVAKVLVDCIREARQKRQVIIVTHNPNLAVVSDADQVIDSTLDLQDGNRITYTTGSLENPAMNISAANILEGTRPAFDIRGAKYEVAE